MLALIRDVTAAIPVPPELLGPAGLAVGAIIVVGVLWRDHVRSDSDVRKQRDDLAAINEHLRGTLDKMSGVVEQDTADRVGRRRRGDT